MIKREKERSIEHVEQMVKDNVITKEKAEKLKEAIKIAKKNKNSQNIIFFY